MSRSAPALVLAAAVLLCACASQGPGTTGEPAKPAASTADAGARISTPVVVPAASAKKVVMSMTGPKQVTESKDWPAFQREWRDTFGDHAKAAGIEFSFIEGEVQPQNVDGTALTVNVADFRMVGIAARIFLGVMTGNAYIDARIKFVNLRDGGVLGEQQHNTSSSAWGGIFAKVTPQQVDAIATEVFRDLKAAK